MQILSILAQGFRSFTAPQALDFTRLRPGLYHLTGRNEVEPELEGNGAGKSSLLEAVCWGLYGRTSRNLRAGAVGNWSGEERCAVALDVRTVAGDLGIRRSWNPNTLSVSVNGRQPRPVDQKELDALLGVGSDAFLFSIYFAQFAPAFIDLRPAEQMAIYSSVLGLDLWAAAADTAGKRGRELEQHVQRRREACARIEGQVHELEALDFTREEKEWNATQRKRTKEIGVEINELTSLRAEAEKKLPQVQQLTEDFHKAEVKMTTAGAEMRNAQTTLQTATAAHKRMLASAKQGVCPLCGAEMSNEHAQNEVRHAQNEVDKWINAVEKLQKQFSQEKKRTDELRGAQNELTEANGALRTLRAKLEMLEKQLNAINNEANPHAAQRAQTEAKLQRLNEEAEREVEALEKADAERAATLFWSKSFKELRLSLIEESLAQLAVEANSALVGLGLRNWSISFDVERETKSGGVSKGFTVTVGAPHVREPVPWEAWSGGESQRLRIAASLGFGELICSRMGMQPNVEFWDEPSTWLSEAGIHDLLEALAERARQRGKIILLADHRALDFGGFSGVINVTKTAAGSRIAVEAPAYNSVCH